MVDQNFTILVKKADGTQVRMTLDEFRLYKEILKSNLNNSNQTVVEKKEEEKIENITPPVEEQALQPISQSVVESPEDDEEKLFDEADTIKIETDKNETKIEPNLGKVQDLPVTITEQSLANTTPVKAIFVDEAIYSKTRKQENIETRKPENKKTINQQTSKPIKLENIETVKQDNEILPKWSSEDHKSLLEEDDEEVKKHHAYSTLPSSNNDLVSKILSQLDFFVAPDLSGRLQSLILSRIKDIRTNEQILEYALKSKESGGLGFSQSEAENLLAVIKKNFNGKVIQSVPEKTTTSIPKKDLDFSDKIVKPSFNNKNKPVFEGKPTLQDVIAPKKIDSTLTFGSKDLSEKKMVSPVDELRTFDLHDWRRLANNPSKAGEELTEKFAILKKDSFVLFTEGVIAWRQSPLYNMYKEVIATCISRQEKIKDYLFNQDKTNNLTPEEFEELVKVNRNLV